MSYPIALLSIFTSLFLITATIVYYRGRQRRLLRQRVRRMPFPESWRSYLERTVHYPGLPADTRKRVERSLLEFVHTKSFSGIGLEVTDEMRVVIAFYACLMVRNRPHYDYPTVSSILVYADEFVVDEHHEEGGIVYEGRSVLDGQSSPDTVVLSWYDVEAEAYHPSEHNVVIHEFAHILDFEDGISDGFPLLPKTEEKQWEHILEHDFRSLQKAVGHGHLSEKFHFLGEYAATNEAEFFAVASERFFMRPDELNTYFPKLYTLLQDFYVRAPVKPEYS